MQNCTAANMSFSDHRDGSLAQNEPGEPSPWLRETLLAQDGFYAKLYRSQYEF